MRKLINKIVNKNNKLLIDILIYGVMILSACFLTMYFECTDTQKVVAFLGTVLLEIILFSYIKNNTECINKKSIIYISIYSFIFSIAMAYSKELSLFYENSTYSFLLNNIKNRIIYIISFYVINSLIFYGGYIYINKQKLFLSVEKKNIKIFKIILVWISIIILWVPYFLAMYPGILSPDSLSQWEQAAGLKSYTDHHPIVSTLTMKLFIMIFGNSNLGVAAYSIFQMLTMSLIFTYTITVINKCNLPKIYSILAFLYYALFPINALYSVTFWKDVFYGGFSLLMAVQLFRIVLTEGEILNIKKHKFLTILSILLVCLFRNNGIYVVIALFAFSLIFYFNNRRLLYIFMTAILLTFIIKIPIMKVLNVVPSNYVEKIGIPMRQVASVVVKDKYISESDYILINRILSVEEIKKNYTPLVSDPLKFHKDFDKEYLAENKAEYSKLWFRLFIKYPVTYIETYLKSTNHLWNPLSIDAWHYTEILNNDIGIYQESKFDEFKSKLTLLNWDISKISMFRIFYSYSILFWLLLYVIIINLIKKNYYSLIVLFIPFLNWLTLMVASPTARQIRYVYSLYTILPLILILLIYNSERKKKICKK